MNEMITALETILEHLVRALSEAKENNDHLKKKTALNFISDIYSDLRKKEDIFHEIGAQNISESQINCLKELLLTGTYSCLKLFINWVQEGFYDFSTIPSRFKAHMSSEDKLALEKLHENFSGSNHNLKKELNDLIENLKFCEKDITSQVNDKINVRQ